MKPSIRLRIIDHEGRGSELLSAELSEAIFRSLSYDEHSEQWRSYGDRQRQAGG